MSERGQVSVEYAIAAATFAIAATLIVGFFQRGMLVTWIEAVRGVVLVSVEDLSDAKAVGRELADR